MANTFGQITNPTSLPDGPQGFFSLLSAGFRIAATVAGIFFIIKIIVAGFGYLNSSGDEKKTAQAFATIWQSAIGFAIVASAFIIASVVGNLFGIDILNPTL